MITQHFQQGWLIRQVAKHLYEIEHDGQVVQRAVTIRAARHVIKRLLTN